MGFDQIGKTKNSPPFAVLKDDDAAKMKQVFDWAPGEGRENDISEALRDAVQRSDPRITATEMLEAPKTPLWQRMREKIERVEQAAWWGVHKAAAEIQHHLERKELHHER